jgi:hypothetical protein
MQNTFVPVALRTVVVPFSETVSVQVEKVSWHGLDDTGEASGSGQRWLPNERRRCEIPRG